MTSRRSQTIPKSRRSIHATGRNTEYYSSSSGSEREDEDNHIEPPVRVIKKDGSNTKYVICGGILTVVSIIYLVQAGSMPKCPSVIQTLKQHKIEVKSDFVYALQGILDDMQQFNQAKSIVLMHHKKIDENLLKVIVDVGKTCLSASEVVDFPLTNFPSDIGRLITKYGAKFRQNPVMLVRNLQYIPGRVAQVFHAFCDDVSSFTGGAALVIFTVKIETDRRNKFSGNNAMVLRQVLWESWRGELDEGEKFEPLFARIATAVLVV